MSTTMLLLLLSVVQVVYMKTYIIQKLELMRHSLDNSSQGNMSTTMLLLLLSVVQVVYMKTYIIETKLNAGSDEQGYGQDNDMDYGWNSGNANVNINNPAPVPAPAVLPPCKLTGWSAWKNEKPCGKTVKSRSRDCKRGSDQCEASECNGDLVKTVDITLGPCCSWAAWGSWSKPADKCVPSKVLRKRKCTKAVPGYYVSCGVEVKCKGLASEEKQSQKTVANGLNGLLVHAVKLVGLEFNKKQESAVTRMAPAPTRSVVVVLIVILWSAM